MNYELSTTSFGTYIYAGTIVVGIVIALSLPILVVCSKSFSRYKERVRERKILNNTDKEYANSSIQNGEKKFPPSLKGRDLNVITKRNQYEVK